MPEISRFFGIVVAMFYNDHPPPHFHVRYGSQRALVDIETLDLIEGDLSPRVRALVADWATAHRQELWENWERVQRRTPLTKIAPLE